MNDQSDHDSGFFQELSQVAGTLRRYQATGVKFLVGNKAALLADEMGLGKTVQVAAAIAFLVRHQFLRRALVVCPSSLKSNWLRELRHWAPEVPSQYVRGDLEDRTAYLMLPIPAIVASYEDIRTAAPQMANMVSFDLVVLDEAQRVKNVDADTALACRILLRERSWALTGTPVENKLDDLLAIFEFLAPGLLNQWDSISDVRKKIAPHFLRRRKADVLDGLPPIIDQTIELQLAPSQARTYSQVWNERWLQIPHSAHGGGREGAALAVITRLKQICNFDPTTNESVKMDVLRNIASELADSGEKVLVFSQYVTSLQKIHSEIGLPSRTYTGEMDASQRDSTLSWFDSFDGACALLISLRAGGVGLNIPAASTVVLFDRWWNPALESQAIHRAHRFGRREPLLVVRFLVLDTVEERISQLLHDKTDLANSVVGDMPVVASEAEEKTARQIVWRVLQD